MTEIPTIPGYLIQSRLGQGGMATVYLAIQQSFEREVALKVMSPLLNSDPSFAARFRREARIVAQLNHASIVPVFEVGEHRSYQYLSMEYLPDGDLKRRILDGKGGLSLALKVCQALGGALEIAHRKGFVHRDIKPENILFREDGTPVLTDFGIARALEGGASMTLAGMLVGTPEYMSPEQVKGLDLDGRSDLYSLGLVFYEILTARVPFKADSTMSVVLKQVGEPLPPLPQEYAEYQEFLDCLTAKDREQRFTSGAEVVRALRLISRALTPSQGLPGRATTGTQISRSQTTTPSDTEGSQPTLHRSRTVGAIRGVEPTLTNPAEGAAVDRGGTDIPPNPGVPEVTVLADPRHLTSDGIRSAEDAEHARVRSVDPKPSADATRESGPDPQQTGGETLSSAASAGNPRPPDSRTDKVNRSLRLSAAIVAAIAICLGLVFISKSPEDARTSPGTRTQVDTRPAAAARSQQPLPTQSTLPTQLTLPTQSTGTSALQHVPAEPVAPPPPMSTANPAVESNKTPSIDAASAAADAARAEAAARRKRLEERQRRKAEAARLVAEAQAAELAAQEEQIRGLLAAAKTQYSAGTLWRPAGSSAADSYRAILKIQPQHTEALAAAHRLADVLAEEAEDALASGNLDSSRQLIDQVQSLEPTHPKLPELEARFEELQTSPSAPGARDRGRLAKAAKYIARAEEDLGRKPLDFKAVDDATDQYDKAFSTAPKAPGLPSLKEWLIAAYPTAVQTELDLNDTKRAQKLIGNARKRNWSSSELDQLETTLLGRSAPTAAIKETGVH